MTGHSVTVREAEWAPRDVAALLAARRDEFTPRNAYGIAMTEATDPTAEFEVPLPLKDFSVEKLQREQDKFAKQYPESKGDRSFVWRVKRKTD